jgi:hypothetical protein
MATRETRRTFLKTAAAGGALLGLSNLSFLDQLPGVTAKDAKLDPKLVRLDSGIEPLVVLLEETPREKLLEEVAGRIHKGLNYRDLLAALLLAGVRNVQPRPNVGFKFHAVLVVNSAHLASLASPDSERWLPIFWSLDYFKDSQAATARESGWRMGPPDEGKIPGARKARQAFTEAMDNWDEVAADNAVAGLARTTGANEVFELFVRYGARDFRDIGHKAIYVANSWRTLQCIGWQHAEPVLRSLAYALQKRENENPAKADLAPDRPWKHNLALSAKIAPDWSEGKLSDEATADLLAVLRQGSDRDACEKVVALLNQHVSPQSIWDAFFLGAGELLARQPGIVPLHAVTSTNALHFSYCQSANEETRKMLMLQNAAFLTLFRARMEEKELPKTRIDQLEPLALETSAKEAAGEIMADVSKDRMRAAQKTLAYLKDHPQPQNLMDAARLLVFLKGTDSHDYKFSSAMLEDYDHVSPAWRARYLSAGMFQFRGSAGNDNRLVERTRAALKG